MGRAEAAFDSERIAKIPVVLITAPNLVLTPRVSSNLFTSSIDAPVSVKKDNRQIKVNIVTFYATFSAGPAMPSC